MNLDRIIGMVVNQVVRRVVNVVVDRGFRAAAHMTEQKPDPEQATADHVTTPAELAKDARLRTMAEQAAKTAKMTRRIGR